MGKIAVIYGCLFLISTMFPSFGSKSLAREHSARAIVPGIGNIPVIDIGRLRDIHSLNNADFCSRSVQLANEIGCACRSMGFFYITNHGVPDNLVRRLEALAREFFALPLEQKMQIAMVKGGKAWRGYFPVGDEVTSGIPDQKEGIYFGTEPPLRSAVVNSSMERDFDAFWDRPLHGRNQWPNLSTHKTESMDENDNVDKSSVSAEFSEYYALDMRAAVLEYMAEMKLLGQLLMRAISCHLQDHAVVEGYTAEPDMLRTVNSPDFDRFVRQFEAPTELFRIFNYPPHDGQRFSAAAQGVGEHTDYGFLTLLKQDDISGGLQVKAQINLENDPTSSACKLPEQSVGINSTEKEMCTMKPTDSIETLNQHSQHNQQHNQQQSPKHRKWIGAPPIPGTFVVNLGDALEHATGGLLRATPHRVLQRQGATQNRLSMPYFFDPCFDCSMLPLVPRRTGGDSSNSSSGSGGDTSDSGNCEAALEPGDSASQSTANVRCGAEAVGASSLDRWDGTDPTQFQGTYGDYLLGKVSKAFPALFQQQIGAADRSSR